MSSTDAVALKLPALWEDDLESWFLQTEAQFNLRGITDQRTRYYHLVAVLSTSNAAKVKDIIRDPPSSRPYSALKGALLSKYELTEYERAAAIMNISLGDRKPSELMDQLLTLLGNHEGGILLKFRFFSLLPDFVRSGLSTTYSDITDLQKLAAEADKIYLTGRDSRYMTPGISAATDDAEVDRVKRFARPSRKAHKEPTEGLCYYHSRFGAKAKKCTLPCNWPGNATAGQQQ
jgi:hypothetical protein